MSSPINDQVDMWMLEKCLKNAYDTADLATEAAKELEQANATYQKAHEILTQSRKSNAKCEALLNKSVHVSDSHSINALNGLYSGLGAGFFVGWTFAMIAKNNK